MEYCNVNFTSQYFQLLLSVYVFLLCNRFFIRYKRVNNKRALQALVDEDRLLSRLECLEDQLSVFAKVGSVFIGGQYFYEL